MRIVQLIDSLNQRRVAMVDEPNLIFIGQYDGIHSLALAALERKTSLRDFVADNLHSKKVLYDEVYEGSPNWQLLPAADHPRDPRYCLVSGTGLTHKASAENRQKMHDAQAADYLTDSMKMYQWGVEGGKPGAGRVGTQPEWFYKGNGSVLRGHGATLTVPSYGDDGGEEPELAAVYINDKAGNPHRIGFATANEFSDHVMEKKNYLYLAPSKIRNCALGPELVLADPIDEVHGRVSIRRDGEVLWEKAIKSGENHMAHSLENLEYHHFKYPNHRLPHDLHVHFLGADAFSFGENIQLADGDEMLVEWEGMGRALRNRLVIETGGEEMLIVSSM